MSSNPPYGYKEGAFDPIIAASLTDGDGKPGQVCFKP